LQGKDLRKLVVREVMSKPLPESRVLRPRSVSPYMLSHENPAVFVEMDEAKFEILTKYDLMSTVAGLMEQNASRKSSHARRRAQEKLKWKIQDFQRSAEGFHSYRGWGDGLLLYEAVGSVRCFD